ncbi:MAG: isoaspartyl peptidase/L-asparaginase [Bacteroidetes bacterium]|nr:isoaspartyl peptidase/L-asparaginase [Bacteroidota bacterium]
MRVLLVILFLFIGNLTQSFIAAQDRYLLVMHGGAGTVSWAGNSAMPFCTERMHRGYIRQDSLNGPINKGVALFKD